MRVMRWLVDFVLYRHRGIAPAPHRGIAPAPPEPTWTSLRLVSDGTPQGTTLCTDDGRIINGVTHISWSISTDELAKATVSLAWLPAELSVWRDDILFGSA